MGNVNLNVPVGARCWNTSTVKNSQDFDVALSEARDCFKNGNAVKSLAELTSGVKGVDRVNMDSGALGFGSSLAVAVLAAPLTGAVTLFETFRAKCESERRVFCSNKKDLSSCSMTVIGRIFSSSREQIDYCK